MEYRKAKVLVIATSSSTKGGISEVINKYKLCEEWYIYKCKWIETHIDKSLIIKLIYFFRGLFRYLLNIRQYDIVHIHLSEPISALRKLIFWAIAKAFKKKIIIHFHSFSPTSTIRSKFHILYKFLFNGADHVIVLSDYWKRELTPLLSDKRKIVVLYNPCNPDKYVPPHDIRKRNVILFAGTLNRRKGYTVLLKAFALLGKKRKNYKLVLAGNGEIKEGEKLCKELGIEKNTVFAGWVEGIEKHMLFSTSKIFCLPSFAEGFAMAILDAWSYGLPVISTPVGGIDEVAENNKNIMLFSPGDEKELATALEILISSEDLREKLVQESQQLVRENFSIDIIWKKLKNIYELERV